MHSDCMLYRNAACRLQGCTGKPLKNVISIGIGGSYLGPEFVYEALRTDPVAKKAAEGMPACTSSCVFACLCTLCVLVRLLDSWSTPTCVQS